MILLTGGAGYIGSHTAVELLASGQDVLIYDNFCNSTPDVIPEIEKIAGRGVSLVRGDIRDKELLGKTFRGNEISAVIHFAGLKAVGESVRKPLPYYDNNVCGTVALLEAMEAAGCRTMIFSSSATVYGANAVYPCREDAELTPVTNPYGATKVAIERILFDICAANSMRSAVLLRYFNPIGAHKSGGIGDHPAGIPNNIMPYIVKVASGELPFLEIFGADYDTPDGTCVRDYLHVVDLAKGHVRALNFSEKNKGAAAVNLGTGKGTSVLELVKTFERVNGIKIPYRISARRPGDVPEMYADVRRAEELLGWTAELSLEDMVLAPGI